MIVSHPHTEAMVAMRNLGKPDSEFAYGAVKKVVSELPDCVGFGNESVVIDLDQERVIALSRINRSEAYCLEEKYFADILHEVLRHTSEYYNPQFLSVYSGTPSIVGSPGSIRERFLESDKPSVKEFIEFNMWVNRLFRSMGNYGNLVYIDMQVDIFSTPPRPGPNLIRNDRGRLTYTDSIRVNKIFDATYFQIDVESFLDYVRIEVTNIPEEGFGYIRDRLEELEKVNYFYRCLPYQLVNIEGVARRVSDLSAEQIDEMFENWEDWQNRFQINTDWLRDIYEPRENLPSWEEKSTNKILSRISHFSSMPRVPYYLRNVFKDGIANAIGCEDF